MISAITPHKTIQPFNQLFAFCTGHIHLDSTVKHYNITSTKLFDTIKQDKVDASLHFIQQRSI